jgi:hypothetical protein
MTPTEGPLLMQWQAEMVSNPDGKAYWSALVDYVRTEGGLIQDFWQRHMGVAFADDPAVRPTYRNPDEVAAELNMSPDEMVDTLWNTIEAVDSVLAATAEGRALLGRLNKGCKGRLGCSTEPASDPNPSTENE